MIAIFVIYTSDIFNPECIVPLPIRLQFTKKQVKHKINYENILGGKSLNHKKTGNKNSQNLQSGNHVESLVTIGDAMSKIGEAISSIAEVLSIEAPQEKKDNSCSAMQKQIDDLASEIERLKRQVRRKGTFWL